MSTTMWYQLCNSTAVSSLLGDWIGEPQPIAGTTGRREHWTTNASHVTSTFSRRRGAAASAATSCHCIVSSFTKHSRRGYRSWNICSSEPHILVISSRCATATTAASWSQSCNLALWRSAYIAFLADHDMLLWSWRATAAT